MATVSSSNAPLVEPTQPPDVVAINLDGGPSAEKRSALPVNQNRLYVLRSMWVALIWVVAVSAAVFMFHGNGLKSLVQGTFTCGFTEWSLAQHLTHEHFIKGQAQRIEVGLLVLLVNFILAWVMVLRSVGNVQWVAAPALAAAPSEEVPVQSADQIRDQLLANLGHEVRTPVAAICSYVELIQRSPVDQMPRIVQNVKASAQHLMDVTQNLLDASKLQAKKLEIQPEDVSLNQLLVDLSGIVNVMVEKHNLDFYVGVQPGLPDSIHTDPLRLRQILLNLMSNAVKFTQEGHIALVVSAKPFSQDTVFMSFSVLDSGIGIDPEKAEHLFESFAQMDGQRTRSYGGVGLGLYISRQLAELLNGSLVYEPNPKGGSVFTLRFPVTVTNLAESYHQARYPDKLCLIVSTHADEGHYLSTALQGHYADCKVVGSAAELLKAIDHATCPVDIVVGKVSPALQSVLASIHVADIQKLALVSALAQAQELSKLREMGIVRHIIRPGLPQEILDAFAINVTAEQSVAKRETDDEGEPLKGKRILLVDDTEMLREACASHLMSFGAEVETASNGAEAVRIALNPARTFDLVLMDVQMPIMDGNEAARQIRKHFSKEQLCIHALTSHSSYHEIKESLDAGMNGHLLKPLQITEVFKLLGHVHDGSEKQAASTDQQGVKYFNPELGLRNFSNSEKVFAKAIQLFVEHLENALQQAPLVDWSDAEKTIAFVHKTRGTSATAGAERLAQMAADLLEHARAAHLTPAHVSSYMACLERTKQAVVSHQMNINAPVQTLQ